MGGRSDPVFRAASLCGVTSLELVKVFLICAGRAPNQHQFTEPMQRVGKNESKNSVPSQNRSEKLKRHGRMVFRLHGLSQD
jgi:hypothetical protein